MEAVKKYRLSPQQLRYWLFQQQELQLFSQAAWIVDNAPDAGKTKMLLTQVLQRHELLKTRYVSQDGNRVFQIPDEQLLVRLEVGPGHVTLPLDELIENIAHKAKGTRFDLEKGPLADAFIVQLPGEKQLIFITLAGICADWWSLNALRGQLAMALAGHQIDPLAENVKYLQFSEWQNILQEEGASDNETYGARMRAHFQNQPKLLFGNNAAYPRDFSCAYQALALPADVRSQFREAKTSGQTELLLASCWNALLWNLAGRENLLIGHKRPCRYFDELHSIVGPFSRYSPTYAEILPGSSFRELMTEYERVLSENNEYRDTIAYESGASFDIKADSFRYLFEFHDDRASEPSSTVRKSFQISCQEPFKLKLHFHADAELECRLEYAGQSFTEADIEFLGDAYLSLVEQVFKDPDLSLDRVDWTGDRFRQRLLEDFNQTEHHFDSRGYSVPRQFDSQVQAQSARTALVTATETLSYGELKDRAVALASYLRSNFDVTSGECIGIRCEENAFLVIACLGVLYARAAYVPIDKKSPSLRQDTILKNSGIRLLLTDTDENNDLADFDGQYLNLHDPAIGAARPATLPEEARADSDLTYVIYTSGTSGKPKGVMIEDRSLVNYTSWFKQRFSIDSSDSTVLLSSFSFDLGYTALWGSILNGAALHVIPAGLIRQMDDLIAYLLDHRITFIKLTPSLFSLLIRARTAPQLKHSALRLILLGGEALRAKDLSMLEEIKPDVTVVNHYGPTEATIGSVTRELPRSPYSEDTAVTIGKPIANMSVFILDRDLRLLPAGVEGEIYLSGIGLARGYLNNEELTREKFIANPFLPQQLMYRTGDLGYRLPDGQIVFKGRADDQVKIRGYRVEKAEVEKALLDVPGVSGAVVTTLAKEDQGNELVAYIQSDEQLSRELLTARLKNILPEYMIPSYFVRLDHFPVTGNGKIDKARLPYPEYGRDQVADDHIYPSTDLEKILVDTWENVLGISPISLDSNFFELGGDSIKAIQIASALFGKNIKVKVIDIFECSTIAELALVASMTISTETDQGTVEGPVPLTPIQKELFRPGKIDPHHYNQAILLDLLRPVAQHDIERIFARLQSHHDALRMRFRSIQGEWQQTNHGEGQPVDIRVIDLAHGQQQQFDSFVDQIQKSIDLADGPLMKLGLIRMPGQEIKLLIVIHHLVVDGVSWRILLEDIQALLQQHFNGSPFTLPKKTSSFREWALKLQTLANSPEMAAQLPYWQKLAGTPYQYIPADFDNPRVTREQTEYLHLKLSQEHTRLLLTEANKAFGTQINDLLVTAMLLAAAEVFGHFPILIAMEGHGREDILPDTDISRTVGWFTSFFPAGFRIEQHQDIAAHLKQVKEILRAVPQNGAGFGILKHLSHFQGDYGDLKPQISFNYLGQFDRELTSPFFKIADQSSGHAMSTQDFREHQLEVNGLVEQGCLLMSLSFSTQQFRKPRLQKWWEAYQANLQEIIRFCAEREHTEVTPSDLGFSDISIQELDNLNSLFS